MAFATAPQAPYSFFIGQNRELRRATPLTRRASNIKFFTVYASQEEADDNKQKRAPPGVDTRIHWDNEDEGWIGGSKNSTTTSQQPLDSDEKQRNLLGEKFADLLNDSSDSHYQFLGVSAEADIEEIKAAYRRLSKEYHPDTTSLPLKTASQKFMRLREVYHVLSYEETRNFYDWTLAQEAASRQAEKMRMKLEDPYVQDLLNYEPVPDVIDQLNGKNLKLSDQAMTALTIDTWTTRRMSNPRLQDTSIANDQILDIPATPTADVRNNSYSFGSYLSPGLLTALVIGGWYFSNIGVLLLNKYLLSIYGFRYPIFLTMTHMLFCAAYSYIAIDLLELVPRQHIHSRKQFFKIFALSAIFCFSVVCGNNWN